MPLLPLLVLQHKEVGNSKDVIHCMLEEASSRSKSVQERALSNKYNESAMADVQLKLVE